MVPFKQQFKIGSYILGKKLKGEKKYPLVLMLEPLFQCNLACAGCGKIQHPQEILKQRLSVEDALNAVDECGAPMVSIPGGEPLLHKDMPQMVSEIIKRKKYVYLCTNAVLLSKRMDDYTPSQYLTFSIHLDGLEEQHDASVCKKGVFKKAVEAIKQARERGFRVTANCTLFQGEEPEEIAEFFDFCMEMGVESINVAPGFSYEKAPRQDVFLPSKKGKEMFRDIFRLGKKRERKWKFNQSSLFLNFLAGNEQYQCTAWSNPTYNVFGWQRPCYLLVNEGYAKSFKDLMENTEWENYGSGRNPKCDNCMMHCGYEGTAIEDTMRHPLKALRVMLKGPDTEGPMQPELPVLYSKEEQSTQPEPETAEASASSDDGGSGSGGCSSKGKDPVTQTPLQN